MYATVIPAQNALDNISHGVVSHKKDTAFDHMHWDQNTGLKFSWHFLRVVCQMGGLSNEELKTTVTVIGVKWYFDDYLRCVNGDILKNGKEIIFQNSHT